MGQIEEKNRVYMTQPQWESFNRDVLSPDNIYCVVECAEDGAITDILHKYQVLGGKVVEVG